eukprot:5181749-Amphidinium_carterae.1
MQAQPRNIMTKCLPCRSETQNMCDGCSTVQAGSCRGSAKWFPISARDLLDGTSRCRGSRQEKSFAYTISSLFSVMCISGSGPSKPFARKLRRDIVP